MATPVEMPKLGNTVEDCLLSKWMKAQGDPVAAGDVIAEIETDKATFEVTAPGAGVLLATFFNEGDLVPVFANICVVGERGESVEQFRPGSHTREVASAVPLQEQRARSEPEPAPQLPAGAVSPRARRFASEHGVDTEELRGSGPNGRVLEADVRDRFYSAPRVSPLELRERSEQTSALSGVREKIARRMRESLSGTAQYTLHSSADATALVALRSRIKAARQVPDINLNDLVLFCTVQALVRMPQLNTQFQGGKLHRSERVHLGFAVDTERGLLVPVIRDAHAMTVSQLAESTKALADRAVKGALVPDEMSGATFTVSNLGALGIEWFTPILNPPQVAILGVGSIELKLARRDGRIEMIDRIGLSLTCDHQVIDGAPGARFLGAVRECIEDVEALCRLTI